MKDRWVKMVATFFYTGTLPFFPGTWGSLAGTLIFLSTAGVVWLQAALFFVLTIAGLWVGAPAERLFARKDPPAVVIDEVAGVFLVFAGLPLTFFSLGAGFLIYRGLDILKPLGLRSLERLPGGWGIMLDDLAAGLFTNLVLRILFQLNILH